MNADPYLAVLEMQLGTLRVSESCTASVLLFTGGTRTSLMAFPFQIP